MKITLTGRNCFGPIWSVTQGSVALGHIVTWRHQFVPVDPDGNGMLPFCASRSEAAWRLMEARRVAA